MKWFFIFILMSAQCLYAQHSDFIILKKGSRNIHTYFPGTNIDFVTSNGAYRNALITDIKNDSVFLQEFLIRRAITQLGFYIIDTVGSFRYKYHYNDIAKIGKQEKKFNWKGSGAALLGGGILITLASGVVYLVDRDKFSPGLMAGAAALGVAGYFMSKSGKGIVIGKKYRLQYMRLSK
jgi:hypothetical protein